MTNEEQNDGALVPITHRHIDRAVGLFEKLERELHGDLRIVLSRGGAKPSYADWLQNPIDDDLPFTLEDVEIFETPTGVVSVWVPVDWPNETPWYRWWDVLEVAGLIFDSRPDDGRRQIVMELLRRCDDDEQLVHLDNAIRRVLEILNEARCAVEPQTLVIHDDGYRSASWRGKTFRFTTKQAAVLEALVNAGGPQADRELLCAANSDSGRLRDIFKSKATVHPAWGTLIKETGKGWRELAAEKIERHRENPA